MFLYRLGYRHLNGEVEGFIGFGWRKETARSKAVERAISKVEAIENVFDPKRLIENNKKLTPAELETIRADWGNVMDFPGTIV